MTALPLEGVAPEPKVYHVCASPARLSAMTFDRMTVHSWMMSSPGRHHRSPFHGPLSEIWLLLRIFLLYSAILWAPNWYIGWYSVI